MRLMLNVNYKLWLYAYLPCTSKIDVSFEKLIFSIIQFNKSFFVDLVPQFFFPKKKKNDFEHLKKLKKYS